MCCKPIEGSFRVNSRINQGGVDVKWRGIAVKGVPLVRAMPMAKKQSDMKANIQREIVLTLRTTKREKMKWLQIFLGKNEKG